MENSKPYIIIGLGFLVIAVSGYQLASGSAGSILDPNKNSGSVVSEKTETTIPNVDSDADGLTDWEEEHVYHTNPIKPDTDADSYVDGTEVHTGHDPLVAGDKPTGAVVSTTGTPTDNSGYYQYDRLLANTPGELNKINALSDAVQSKATSATGNGSTDDQLSTLATLALSNAAIKAGDVIPKVSDSEIHVTPDSGKAAIQQYVTALASIGLETAPFKDQQAAASFLSDALKGDKTKAEKIVEAAPLGVKQLKALPVPAEAVSIHKLAIGLLELTKTTGEGFLNFNSKTPQEQIMLSNDLRVVANGLDGLSKDVITLMQKYNINAAL